MRFLKLGVFTILGAMAVMGCRFPKLYHVRSRPEPVIYDTAWEQQVSSDEGDSRRAVLRRQFCDTLAEPVCVVDWHEGVSSNWKFFYATNRSPMTNSAGESAGDIDGYGNGVLSEVSYGACSVRLPHRDRGEDAKTPDLETARGASRNPLIETLQPLEPAEFIEALTSVIERSRQRDLLIFVHGFNVSYDQAMLRAAQVAADLPFNGAVLVYSWPSQGGIDQYARDEEVINESVPAFSQFLTEIGESLPQDISINLVVHSMGNRLVTKSLWRVPDSFTNPPRFRELVFCAPDVSVEDFKRDARQIVAVSQRATLYKSSNDSALIASKWRHLDERAGEALGMAVEGMDTIETAVVDTSAMGHSYYGSNPSVLRDLFAVVKEHRPAEERPWLKRRSLPFTKADLWIMDKFPEPLEWRWHFPTSSASGSSL